jgi:hypothetical protein
MESEMAGWKPYVDLASSASRASARPDCGILMRMHTDLFDPGKPLPEDVVLIHDQGGGAVMAWVYFTLAGVLGIIAACGVFEMAMLVSHEMGGKFWFYGVVALGVMNGALWLFYKARAIRRALADIARGTYRHGLFFLNDRLILRSGTRLESWHIDEVADVKLVRDPGNTHFHGEWLALVLRDEGGATREHRLKAAGGFAEALSALIERIARWRDRGFRDLPIPERFR